MKYPAWWKKRLSVAEMEAVARWFGGESWYAPYRVFPVPSGYSDAFYDWVPIAEQLWAEENYK